jgi:outer membrane protein TolC
MRRVCAIAAVVILNACCLGQQVQTTSQPQTTLTLQDVLQRARANSTQFLGAQAEAALAKEDHVQSRAALLPSVNYNNQFIYTEGTGTAAPRFIANNGVHEYISQGNAHEVISLEQFADYRRTGYAAAVARARAEIAARGLVVTAVQNYYALLGAQRKDANAKLATTEASNFLSVSQKLEKGGEVAHSDVLKAQLQFNDRSRDLREAELGLLKAKLDLAVLIFPGFNTNFTVVDDAELVPPVPSLDEVQKQASKNNPDLQAALASLQMSRQEVLQSRAAHLPALSLDYFYGIDASHFAVRTDGIRNLGYAAQATLNIPIFNWGAIQSRVRQSQIRERLAQAELSAAQRQVLANLQSFYNEAEAAQSELKTLRESVDIAAETLRLINLRYQAGESTVLEVVDAQNTLYTARNNYADGAVRYRIALANLQTLTGTL